ncbi:MAG TPA: TetR/AcrR family transcriptional regulator [Nocardioides sp.]|uniref:TetR/AcrR family transcriptional regulator n=1 Tax=Nocardioides sp. TaxID=35761 RepID=UPI002CCC39BE|nr:TetR/AcrR family transcriptional regulator [Nocardioides sp.]HTW14468.1 TetR/AcrR family transcriptional regulator [Nocardioides sp.]
MSRSTRDRLLDAAEECLRRDGIRRTTAAGVAEVAGVSRAGLYKHFPDKATLLSAALIRRDEAFWAEAHERVGSADGMAAKVAEAVVMSRDSPLGPLALELREREPDAFASVMGTFTDDIVPGLAGFWEHHLELARETGEVRADLDLAGAAEWILRVVISLVAVPGVAVDVDDRASVRDYLQTYLVPALT